MSIVRSDDEHVNGPMRAAGIRQGDELADGFCAAELKRPMDRKT
jgi:hypothetical protein